ncbi:MAG: molybdate ABC transporter substrate-binding protein [Alphaproteobacteria bacterium]|nr:molybdate ABC transporter substrate-binding protein [Alphaproteobacteria bacterium]
MIIRFILAALLASLLSSWGGVAFAGEVRLAVASNFIEPVNALARRFQDETGHHVVVSTGSTGKLYAQITNGAPFDVFLAANEREPQRLEQDGLAAPGSRFTYALGRLALWCREADGPETAKRCLNINTTRLAIANPRLAPYGQAARQVLAALSLQDALQGRIVSGENISQTYQMVWSGNVPVGFVALSQVLGQDELMGAYWPVPPQLHAPIAQQAVLLSRAKGDAAAEAFMAFLQGPDADAVIRGFGYDRAGGE